MPGKSSRAPRTAADRKKQNIAKREAKQAERGRAAKAAVSPPTPFMLGQQGQQNALYDYYIDGPKAAPAERKPASSSAFTRLYWWCYRRRVELAPFAVGAGLLATSATAHATAHAAGWVAFAGAVGNVAVWLPWARRKWDRKEERLYVRAITAAGATWASVAAFVGPNAALLALLAGGVLGGGYFWWRHKLVRPQVEGDDDDGALLAYWQAQWAAVRDRLGLEKSRVIEADGDADYVALTVQLVPGVQVAEDVKGMRVKIAGALRLPVAGVRVETVKSDASLVKIFVVKVSPISAEVPWSEAATMLPTSLRSPATFVLGRDETGKWRRVDPRGHWMIIGESRSGKSNGLHAFMANATACDDTLVWFIDLKGGAVGKRWADSIDRLADTIDKAEALLEAGNLMIDQRPNFAPVGEGDGDQLDPSPDMPAIYIVCDEFAEAVRRGGARLVGMFESIARRGAALGIYLVLVAQDGSLESFGTEALRGQLTRRLCYRVAKADNAQYVLAGWSKLQVTALEDGQFFYHHRDDVETPIRAPFMTPKENRKLPQQIAAEHAALRPALDAKTAAAGGAFYAEGWGDTTRNGATPGKAAAPRPDERQNANTPNRGDTRMVDSSAQQLAAQAEAEAAELFGDAADIPKSVERFAPEQVAAELASAEDRFAAAFGNAPAEGLDRKTLIAFAAMSPSWIDERLTALVDRGALERLTRGRYRAADDANVRTALRDHAERKRAALV
jgi:S-DNA-T family DNA segregation ATPase FtsK/SpoIIIE